MRWGRIGEMVLRPARHKTAGIATLSQGFVTQQGIKPSRQDDITNKSVVPEHYYAANTPSDMLQDVFLQIVILDVCL